MKRIKLGFLRLADRLRSQRLHNGMILFVTVVAAMGSVYKGVSMWGTTGGTTSSDTWLFGGTSTLAALGLLYFGRRLCLRVVHTLLSLALRLLAFPVLYIKDQARWLYFAITAGGVMVSVWKLASVRASVATDFWLYAMLGCSALFTVSALYFLVRHRLAEVLAVVAVLPLLAAGLYLLHAPAPQEETYNQVIGMKQTEEGKKELGGQIKLLDASLTAFTQKEQGSRLNQIVFGAPPIDLAARTHFHKAVALVQQPNKGKEAFDECAKSLMLNPGNMYSGALTADEMALWKNDSDQARRLLEKLIRSGQDAGRGRANQPGTPGEQGPPSPDRRDPNRQPQPGSGRQPNKIL